MNTKLNTIKNDLEAQASKLQSKKTHLSNLLRKRARLDYEIVQIKKSLKTHRKLLKGTKKVLQEESEAFKANPLSYVIENQLEQQNPVQSDFRITSLIDNINQEIQEIEELYYNFERYYIDLP